MKQKAKMTDGHLLPISCDERGWLMQDCTGKTARFDGCVHLDWTLVKLPYQGWQKVIYASLI